MLAVDPVTVQAAFCLIKMQTTAEKKLPEQRRSRNRETLRLAHQLQRETIQQKRKEESERKTKQQQSKAAKTKSNKQPATGCGLVGARGMPGTWHKA